MPQPATVQVAAPDHIRQIDGLRALAILMVFVHHAFNVPQLWAGVDLFFILSGFLITGILLKDSVRGADGRPRFTFPQLAKRFYLRRAQRILPAYCIFLFAAVPLVPIAWKHLWPWYAFFAQNLPVAFYWIPLGPLEPLWSLGVENQFYLIWPLVVFFIPRRWLAPSMVALLVGEPVLRYFASPHFVTPAPIYALTPFRLDALAAGALFALVLPGLKAAQAKHAKLAGQISIAVGILLLVALTAHYPWFRRMSNAPAYNALIYSLNILVLGGLFLWAWLSRGPLTRVLSHPVLGWLGRISYMFYLSHLFFLYYAGRLLLAAHVHSHVVAVAFAFAATCAFSTLSWTAVEKPILSLGRAKHPGKLAKAEATANAQAAA